MKWYTDLTIILEREPEFTLAYVRGAKVNDFIVLRKEKRRIIWPAIFALLLLMYRASRITLRRQPRQHVDFFAYAGSNNQIDALYGCLKCLDRKSKNTLLSTGRHVNKSRIKLPNVINERYELKTRGFK